MQFKIFELLWSTGNPSPEFVPRLSCLSHFHTANTDPSDSISQEPVRKSNLSVPENEQLLSGKPKQSQRPKKEEEKFTWLVGFLVLGGSPVTTDCGGPSGTQVLPGVMRVPSSNGFVPRHILQFRRRSSFH